MLFNYYTAENKKGVIQHSKFKAFIEPAAEVFLTAFTPTELRHLMISKTIGNSL